jgi:hypothetical protein
MIHASLRFSDGKTTEQLAKLIRLIFISDQPGEVSGAIAAARRLLATENRDAHWLAERLIAPVQNEPELDADKSTIWWCFHRRHLLSQGDCKFIEDISRQHKPLSPRQRQWLHDICKKLERQVAA